MALLRPILTGLVLWLSWGQSSVDAAPEFHFTAEDRAHWAFQPLKRPGLPTGSQPIDAFVRATLKTNGLTPNPPASPRELIRRVYFDLIGLPPSPEEVAAFEKSSAPDRYEKVVDHLLSLPQYGERWARHWLDLARFAQSNGYERDGEKFLAWRYRDYVIQAFNDDKPYNRFILEQLAGDELPDATADSVVATGFQRLGVWDDEPDDKRMAEFDALDDVLATTGATFLGLTLGCARCHDHKSDPISQRDYYSLLAFFRGVRPFENGPASLNSAGFAPLAAPRAVQDWLAHRKEKLKPLEEKRASSQNEAEKKQLEQEIKRINEDAPFEWTLAVREAGSTPPATHVLLRGNPAAPTAAVEPAFLPILNAQKPNLPAPAPEAVTSGRRRALAEWIASPENPLTARVLVNRVWQHHFGKGLVKTVSDFGRAGATPTHPQLLDWLATEFIQSGWSIKKLHKLILLSETYRQSSRADRAAGATVDPANQWLWRQSLRRLEAEALRDSILSIAGTLNLEMKGRGFFPHLGGEVLAGQSRPGLDWEVSTEKEKCRRTVYAFVRRTMAVPLLESFDYSNTTSPLAERATTTVAPQALMLLNDDFLQEQAAAFADRVRREAGEETARQIERAYQLALNRVPAPGEIRLAQGLLLRQKAAFEALAGRLTFRLDVAGALATDYFDKLPPTHFLLGPRLGWNYYRGFWAPAYEGIRAADRLRGPFALWSGRSFKDGVLEATLILGKSSELASLLIRATAHDDIFRGYELALEPRAQKVTLRRHGRELINLATARADLPTTEPLALKMEVSGAQIRLWLQGDPSPVLDVIDEDPILAAGQIGVRTWGGSLDLDPFLIALPTAKGEERLIVPSGMASPTQQALRSFCLLLLNLNELAYVD